MRTHLVVTITCPDRPGIVERITEVLGEQGANWEESRMARLGGEFAGMVLVSVAADKAEPLAAALRGLADEQMAVVLFTSGSEKEPKAVPLTHGNIWANLQAVGQVIEFGPDDILLANLPYFHVFGLTVDLWLGVERGMTIVTYPNPLEYRTICQVVRDHKVTLMVGTPAFFHGYLRQSREGDFASVRIAVSGADKLPASAAGMIDRRQSAGQCLDQGVGTTVIPVRTRCKPSTTTLSPACKPDSTTHKSANCGPSFTVLMVTLLS